MRARTLWKRVLPGCEGVRGLDLSLPQDSLFPGRSELVHRKRSSLVLKVRDAAPGLPAITVWKWSWRRIRWEGMLDLFLASRAQEEFDNALRLLSLGLRVPRPLAAGEVRTLRWLRCWCLVTEWVDHDGTVASVWAERRARGLGQEWIAIWGREIRRAHDLGVVFRDSRPENLLVGLTEEPRFHFIDLIDLCRPTPERIDRSVAHYLSLLKPPPSESEVALFMSGYRGGP